MSQMRVASITSTEEIQSLRKVCDSSSLSAPTHVWTLHCIIYTACVLSDQESEHVESESQHCRVFVSLGFVTFMLNGRLSPRRSSFEVKEQFSFSMLFRNLCLPLGQSLRTVPRKHHRIIHTHHHTSPSCWDLSAEKPIHT